MGGTGTDRAVFEGDIVTQIERLGLTKLFLWSEAERFQTYPQAMARLTPGRTYTRQQIGEELFGLVYAGSRRPRRESLLSNLFGMLQIGRDKLLLRGINLFRRVTPNGAHRVSGMTVWERASDEWSPTESALQLGEAYRHSPDDLRWKQLLAEQLARYEPRTRVLLHLLSHGHALRFESPGYFGGSTRRAQLVGNNTYELFGEKCAAFNRLLFEHVQVAIGPWWNEEIGAAGFELAEGYGLEGAMNRPPSTNQVNSALKTALYVFHALDVLVESDGLWFIDADALARHLSQETARDLLGDAYVRPLDLSDEWVRLAYVIDELADERGFVVASEAAEYWGELSDLPPGERFMAFDTLIRRGIFEERVEVLDRHLGQPRMGRGLLDDDNMRMVKLRVLT
jgi:hypothetical protein